MLHHARTTLALASLLTLLAAGCSSFQRQSYSSRTTAPPNQYEPGASNRAEDDQRNEPHLANWRPGVNVPANYR